MEIPKQNSKDIALKLSKGLLGAIPYAGAFVGELMELIIIPEYQKKLDEWFEYVDLTIKELVEKQGKSKEEIFADEEFISMFQRTSKAYVNNVEKNKIPILKACLKSSITKKKELNKRLIFLEIIDKLTEKQFLILKSILDNQHSGTYKYSDELKEYLTDKYANGESAYYNLLEKGLIDFHLLNFRNAKTIKDGKNQWHMTVSTIGNELIDYLNI